MILASVKYIARTREHKRSGSKAPDASKRRLDRMREPSAHERVTKYSQQKP